MPSLYENFDNAHDGEAMTALGDEFGLTPTQTPGCGNGASSRDLNGPKAINGHSGWPRKPVRHDGTAAKPAGHV